MLHYLHYIIVLHNIDINTFYFKEPYTRPDDTCCCRGKFYEYMICPSRLWNFQARVRRERRSCLAAASKL